MNIFRKRFAGHPITEPMPVSVSQICEHVGENEPDFKRRVRVLLSEGVKPEQFGVVSMPGVKYAVVYLCYTDPLTDQMQRPTIAIVDDADRLLYHRRAEKWLVDELARIQSLKIQN